MQLQGAPLGSPFELLCSYKGLPKGVNYMIIGDPGVGKTTIILDLLSNIRSQNPDVRVLFISAEMNEIDLAIYVQRFPKFQDLDILFIEASFDDETETHSLETVKATLEQGWDIVAIDSFYELQGIIKDEENYTLKKAESVLLSLIKKQNKAANACGINTTFLTIQQVTKTGHFIGSNRLKHAITAPGESQEHLFRPLRRVQQAPQGRRWGTSVLRSVGDRRRLLQPR